MQNLSARERTMVIVCIVFLIAVVIFIKWPSGQPASGQKLLSRDQAEAKYHQDAAKYVDMGRQTDDLGPRMDHLSYEASAETLVPQLVRDLQLIAAKSGVHLHEIRPLRPRLLPSKLGARVPFEVRFRATFQPDVVRFLYYVEAPNDKMVVDKIDITSAGEKFKTVDVTAQVTVFTRSVSGITGSGEGETSDVSESPGQG